MVTTAQKTSSLQPLLAKHTACANPGARTRVQHTCTPLQTLVSVQHTCTPLQTHAQLQTALTAASWLAIAPAARQGLARLLHMWVPFVVAERPSLLPVLTSTSAIQVELGQCRQRCLQPLLDM
jgi:hypothetical protein